MKVKCTDLGPYDLSQLRADCRLIIEKYPFPTEMQICLTHRSETEDIEQRIYEGVGKLNKLHDEFDYSQINTEFEGLYIYEILQKLSQDYQFGRSRLAQLPPRKCYSMHRDYSSKRYHLAIFTNPHSFITYQDKEMYHIPADGFIYEMDTGSYHSGFNGGSEDRIHLLLEMKKRQE